MTTKVPADKYADMLTELEKLEEAKAVAGPEGENND